jgi:hypothetical protein
MPISCALLCFYLTDSCFAASQTANGAVACQLLDALYPNTVPMKKVQHTKTCCCG